MLAEILTLLLSPITWMLRSRRRLTEAEIRAFYQSWEWKRLRYDALKRYGRRCRCCGAGGHIVVDHIRPVRTHPHLRLKLSNLQTLCNDTATWARAAGAIGTGGPKAAESLMLPPAEAGGDPVHGLFHAGHAQPARETGTCKLSHVKQSAISNR